MGNIVFIALYTLWVKLFGSTQANAELPEITHRNSRSAGIDPFDIYRDVSSETDMLAVIARHNRIGDRVTEHRALEEELAEFRHQQELAKLQGQVDAAKAHQARPGTFRVVDRTPPS